jgi:hypothetical protein
MNEPMAIFRRKPTGNNEYVRLPVLIVEVDSADTDRAQALISSTVDSILAEGGAVLDIFSSVVIGAFYAKSDTNLVEAETQCEHTAAVVQGVLDGAGRILHGTVDVFDGNLGSSTVLNIGPHIRRVSDLLQEMRTTMDFGSIRKIQ